MEIKNRQKVLLVTTIAIGALYAANALIINPLTASWHERSKTIAELRDKISQGKRTVSRRNAIEAQWDRMRTNALPGNVSSAEAQLLKAFDRWERASGITRISIKPQWKRTEDDYMTLECRADYNADIDKLRRFLYEVEKDPTGLKVDNIEVASRDDNGAQLTLGIQISGLLLNPPPEETQ